MYEICSSLLPDIICSGMWMGRDAIIVKNVLWRLFGKNQTLAEYQEVPARVSVALSSMKDHWRFFPVEFVYSIVINRL